MSDQDYQRIMRLKPGDERRYALAEKGVLIMDDEIDGSASYSITLDFTYRLLYGIKTPVWLLLNSPGGNVSDGFAIYDGIKALTGSGVTVNVVGMGRVASMATAIMQAGSRRYSLPHTQFLVHQVRHIIGFFEVEEVNQGKERVVEMERLNDIVMGLIADRAGIDLEKLKELSKKTDVWLDPVKAKEFGQHGLIDEIVTTFPFQL